MEREIKMLRLENRNMKTAGFTLIEIFIVLAILSIFLAIGMPSFLEFTRCACWFDDGCADQ